MHTSPVGCGVVQWIDPYSRGSKRNGTQYSSESEDDSFSYNEDKFRTKRSRLANSNSNSPEIGGHRGAGGDKHPVVNASVTRIICTIVDQHLGELIDHQRLIDRARTNLANSETWKMGQPSIDPQLIHRRDIWKLRVRDQQTKATDTIKQLTNYLRELTYLIAHCQLVGVEDEIFNSLSDSRTEIVQALNDFVLSNSDIEVPIFDSEDNLPGYEYDLCADAHRRDCSSSEAEISSLNNDTSVEEAASKLHSDDGSLLNGDMQFANLDQRKRDVERLERDTEQLRVLFSDFYSLVKSHGEQVDSIEDNIVIAIQHVKTAEVHSHHLNNKVIRGLTVLVPVTGCMAGVLVGGPLGLVVGGKLGGITVACATSILGLISSYKIRRCIV